MNHKGTTVTIGSTRISTRTDSTFPLTRQARSRGMASVIIYDFASHRQQPEYGRVKLSEIRDALDTLTLGDDETAQVFVPIHGGFERFAWRYWYNAKHGLPGLLFSLTPSGKIAVLLPCGEKRRFKVRTLDRALTRLGA